MLTQQGTNAAPLELREALAHAVEEAVGCTKMPPAELLESLLTCLDRALPTPPGRNSVIQELLGLHAHQVPAILMCSVAPLWKCLCSVLLPILCLVISAVPLHYASRSAAR